MTKDFETNGKNITYDIWDTAGSEKVRESGLKL